MPRVGIVSVAQTVHARRRDDANPAELVYPVVREAVAASGLGRGEIEYTSAGSSDFLEGRPFSFGFVLDLVGAVPPIEESHAEMDGAWAAYDAWLRIQAGDVSSALVVAWGKSSEGSLTRVLNTSLDPFYEAPLGLDAVAIAALEARAWMDATGATERDLAGVVARNRSAALRNPFAQVRGGSVEEVLASPYVVEPLRRAMLPPVTDGSCAIVMVSEEVARRLGVPVAWIAGAAHFTDGGCLGARPLEGSFSALAALGAVGAQEGGESVRPDVAEITAPFPHQELMLRGHMGLDGSQINPSGGALSANPIMATGLVRLAEAALQVTGRAGDRQVPDTRRALAHATGGHALQQNLVWLLQSEQAAEAAEPARVRAARRWGRRAERKGAA